MCGIPGIRGSGSRDAMADTMTECIRILLGRRVVRADQLEILLLLAGASERGWTRHAKDGSN